MCYRFKVNWKICYKGSNGKNLNTHFQLLHTSRWQLQSLLRNQRTGTQNTCINYERLVVNDVRNDNLSRHLLVGHMGRLSIFSSMAQLWQVLSEVTKSRGAIRHRVWFSHLLFIPAFFSRTSFIRLRIFFLSSKSSVSEIWSTKESAYLHPSNIMGHIRKGINLWHCALMLAL